MYVFVMFAPACLGPIAFVRMLWHGSTGRWPRSAISMSRLRSASRPNTAGSPHITRARHSSLKNLRNFVRRWCAGTRVPLCPRLGCTRVRSCKFAEGKTVPRAFLAILDSVGIGGAPDAADYGDYGADTVRH